MTPTPSHFGRTRRLAGAAILSLLAAAGCVSPWERSALLDDKRAEIGSVQGPTERGLLGRLKQKRLDDPDALSKPIPGSDQYHAAEELYASQDYPAAEEAFKKVSKKFKKSEIREDALFMEAEAAFAQEHYARAHDLYATIVKNYPTTRHLDKISARTFKIAMIWLDHPQVAEVGEIQQVNHEDYGHKLPPEEKTQAKRNVIIPNFTDKKYPVLDRQGNALVALKSIWTYDAAGPLADDALMLTASYHARAGDFVEADRHFTMLREQFPNSPHVQKAFELGSHVKLMSYQGAPYDGKALSDAKQLKLATLRLYPEMENKELMESQLKRIDEAEADRLWQMVLYYERKGKKRSAATYAHMLLAQYPESKFVPEVQKRLERYGTAYADGHALLNPYPDAPKTLWTAIFPPDDHDGIPIAPKKLPGEPKSGRVLFAKTKPKSKPVGADAPEPVSRTASSEPDSQPRPLPDDADEDAQPLPAGRATVGGGNDSESGHTRLNN